MPSASPWRSGSGRLLCSLALRPTAYLLPAQVEGDCTVRLPASMPEQGAAMGARDS